MPKTTRKLKVGDRVQFTPLPDDSDEAILATTGTVTLITGNRCEITWDDGTTCTVSLPIPSYTRISRR